MKPINKLLGKLNIFQSFRLSEAKSSNENNSSHSDLNDMNVDIFHSITPIKVKEENNSYYEALDRALKKRDEYNIGLLGPYGAGKSSIIKSYIEDRKLANKTLFVTLGNYDNANDTSSASYYEKNENRIERQIIYQLASQIPRRKIKLSSYAFLNNTPFYATVSYVIVLCFILLPGLCLFSDRVYNLFPSHVYKDQIIVSTLLFFTILLCFMIKSKLRFNKLNLQIGSTSAEFQEHTNNDETIFDRELKQIEYMLRSSNATVVVFEDLDRFNDIRIFNKLKEINLLVNNSLKANSGITFLNLKLFQRLSDRRIKFIYLLRDDLLPEEDRIKYFDFPIPVIPIVNYSVAEHYLTKEFLNIKDHLPIQKDFGNNEITRFLTKISIYISDIRLANNILNEFVIYSKNIKLEEFSLNWKYLFSIVMFKNLYPREFELLRKKEGRVYNLLKELEKTVIKKAKESNSKSIQSIGDYFYLLGVDVRQEFMKNIKEEIHPFLSYVIGNNYLDMKYDYYDVNNAIYESSYLSVPDSSFIRTLLSEKYEFDYAINNAELVYGRLDDKEFEELNIVNVHIISYMMNNASKINTKELQRRITNMTDAVIANNKQNRLFQVLDSLKENTGTQHLEFLNLLYKYRTDSDNYIDLLEYLYKNENANYQGLIIDFTLEILKYNPFDAEIIESFKNEFITICNESLTLTEKDYTTILNNLVKIDFKLKNFNKLKVSQNIYEKIGELNLYEPTSSNVLHLMQQLDAQITEDKYVEMIDLLNDNSCFENLKEYLFDEEIWNFFIQSYLNTKGNLRYKNQTTLERILTKSSLKFALQYIPLSDCEVNNLAIIIKESSEEERKEIITSLLKNNKIELTTDNINELCNTLDYINVALIIEYLNTNTDNEKFHSIIKDSNLDIHQLILENTLSDNLFNNVYSLNNIKFDTIGEISEDHLKILIDNNQVECNEYILGELKENKRFENINLLLSKDDNFDQYYYDFIYNISNAETIKAITKSLYSKILFEKLNDYEHIELFLKNDDCINDSNLIHLINYWNELEDDIRTLLLERIKGKENDNRFFNTFICDHIFRNYEDKQYIEQLFLHRIKDSSIDDIIDYINQLDELTNINIVLEERDQEVTLKEDFEITVGQEIALRFSDKYIFKDNILYLK